MRMLKILKLDSRGRINLSILAKGISGFRVTIDKQGRYILDPLSEIPARLLKKRILHNHG